MKIDLVIESDLNCQLTASDLELIADDILSKLDIKKPQATIEVFLVTDAKIQNLNKQYREKDVATDVLSFPQKSFPTKNEEILGTIFIAPQFAKKENIDCEELYVHGVLHLLGFDHETDIKSWFEAEKKIERKTS